MKRVFLNKKLEISASFLSFYEKFDNKIKSCQKITCFCKFAFEDYLPKAKNKYFRFFSGGHKMTCLSIGNSLETGNEKGCFLT